jgi:YhgE/Pip-like protein
VFYVGANIHPADRLTKLPVGLANADEGVGQVNLGARMTASIEKSTASEDKIDWKVMDEKEVKEELGEGKLFGALVVPADFTSSVTALTATTTTGTPARPTLTVLTNQSAGSLGSGLARTATTRAAENASLQVGKELTARIGTAQGKLPAAARVLLADPAAVTVEDGHPLDFAQRPGPDGLLLRTHPSSRSSSRCGRSPVASARSSTTTPRATRVWPGSGS